MPENNTLQPIQCLASLDFVIVTAKLSDFNSEILCPLLSEDELKRMRRFRQPADVQRYILAHALKRLCLSQCLESPLSELSFGIHRFGKPFCHQAKTSFFNLSHSGNWVVMAISTQSEVGIDIDFPRDINLPSIMKRVCSEQQIHQCLNSSIPEELFLYFWVQKEAISKADGQGIFIGMSKIACSGELGEEKVSVLSNAYHLWTYPWGDGGALACALLVSERYKQQAPRLFQLKKVMKIDDGFDCMLFELQ
ncbi:hypothetical protein AB835_10440 [Candidatus Endobugula sertula]|uniref:Uncharacterized protein n=1 Tax=Candidatus Endobugula sertula TaxID=62101 RepID=A0A1D2QNG5_9GAMM|nr:hypothetical protein AB835_10440 [Candidatus Endobugula sertula]